MTALKQHKQEGWQWSAFQHLLDERKASQPKLYRAKGEQGEALSLKETNDLIAANQRLCKEALHMSSTSAEPMELLPQAGAGQFSLALEAGEEAVLLERVEDQPLNFLEKITLAPNARLTHYRFFEPSTHEQFFHNEITLGEGSVYRVVLLTSGALQQRVDYQINLAGEGANAEVCTLACMKEAKHCDIGMTIAHEKPNTKSSIEARALLVDSARANFRPTGFIGEGAEKVVLNQLTKGLLLSEESKMNTKPELAIYHDDVECSHGVACASLDEKALFYFGSRGIEEKQAKEILLEAFIAELFVDDERAYGVAKEKLAALL